MAVPLPVRARPTSRMVGLVGVAGREIVLVAAESTVTSTLSPVLGRASGFQFVAVSQSPSVLSLSQS